MEAFDPRQHIFQGFFGQPNVQIEPKVPEYITQNEIVLEIVNNWPFVICMMNKFKKGELKQVDQMEQLWFNFIGRNSINVDLYSNNEEFLNAFWKTPLI